MVGTTGAIAPMDGDITTHGYGIIGAMELMEVMVGAGTTHGVGTDGTIGAGADITDMGTDTDGVDGIPLIMLMVMAHMGILIIIGFTEIGMVTIETMHSIEAVEVITIPIP